MGVVERRERERLQRKKDILDAARTLLFQQGLQATSVNAIAKESELSIGTIYFYFKNNSFSISMRFKEVRTVPKCN